jgi:hypothetical protein
MSTASTSCIPSQNKPSPSSWASLPLETRQIILYLATSVDYADLSDGRIKEIQELPGKIATLMQVNKLMRSDMAFVVKQHKKEVWSQYDKLEMIATKKLKDRVDYSVENIGSNLTCLRNALDVAFVIHRLTKQVS